MRLVTVESAHFLDQEAIVPVAFPDAVHGREQQRPGHLLPRAERGIGHGHRDAFERAPDVWRLHNLVNEVIPSLMSQHLGREDAAIVIGAGLAARHRDRLLLPVPTVLAGGVPDIAVVPWKRLLVRVSSAESVALACRSAVPRVVCAIDFDYSGRVAAHHARSILCQIAP